MSGSLANAEASSRYGVHAIVEYSREGAARVGRPFVPSVGVATAPTVAATLT